MKRHIKKVKRRDSAAERIAQLAKMGEVIVHAEDLRTLWGISGNTLRVTLRRYAAAGLLYRVYRGLYATVPVDQVNGDLLGVKMLHAYAYVSCETVLARAGVVQQGDVYTTLVSDVSRVCTVAGRRYRFRQLAPQFLYNDYGTYVQGGVRYATTERAVADMLYFNPEYYFDAHRMLDWEKVKEVQRVVGYPVHAHSRLASTP